ncbi:MAG TPA: ATP-dependent DNA helicase RecG [Gammaproteobacteria bacterium]|nr:ATP-dependent DNA helicase RecG [Gammaproteobacteria bacterium]
MAPNAGPEPTPQPRAAVAAGPVTSLRGVGAELAARLARIGVTTVEDLFFLLPLRYEDRTRVVPIGALRAGARAVVEGEVQLTEVAFRGRRSLLSCIADGTGSLTLRFFHFSRAQAGGLARGVRLRCFGEVRRGAAGLEMIHPDYRVVAPGAAPPEESLTPVYPATEGLQQGRLRRLTALALEILDRHGLEELLPAELRSPLDLPPLADAVRTLHRPPPDASLEELAAGRHPAQRRLAFEELLAQHLCLRALRRRMQRERAPALAGDGRLRQRFLTGLGFVLTPAQQRVTAEIRADLVRPRPMLRLLQGDVGSGKTVVAALAAIEAVESGCQAAIMAPTELLAEQHFRSFDAWLRPLGLEVAWLTGTRKGRARSAALAAIESGTAAVAVGTHALFQSGVRFARLALVVVDEQHRFGVHQRLALRDKGAVGGTLPHQLIMTATPIPRTLAMTAYADLDSSVLDELPPGRRPVRTAVAPETRRAEVLERVQRACAAGRQAYWVCPLIGESEALACEAAETTHAGLAAALPQFRVGLAHGRQPAREKERILRAFKAGEIDLLVATTVIEVGVDVPNASLMIIENAERMGLAQLHQLRGRVGRGDAQSDCVLLYRPPLSATARARLSVLRETIDGFAIAERDLELRGPGEVLGTRQTGELALRVADVLRDQDLLPQVRKAAELLVARYPQRIAPLVRRWVGAGARYGGV